MMQFKKALTFLTACNQASKLFGVLIDAIPRGLVLLLVGVLLVVEIDSDLVGSGGHQTEHVVKRLFGGFWRRGSRVLCGLGRLHLEDLPVGILAHDLLATDGALLFIQLVEALETIRVRTRVNAVGQLLGVVVVLEADLARWVFGGGGHFATLGSKCQLKASKCANNQVLRS